MSDPASFIPDPPSFVPDSLDATHGGGGNWTNDPDIQPNTSFGRPMVRMNLQKNLLGMLPMAAATGLAMAAPEASIAAPLIERLGPLAVRLGLGMAGGATGRGIQQAAQGQAPQAASMLHEGARQGVMALPGEALAEGGAMAAPALMRMAWRMTPATQKAAGANMTSVAKEMYPEGEKLWLSAMKERVPPNAGVIAGRATPIAAQKARILAADAAKGGTYTAFDVIQNAGVPELRAELSKLENSAPALKELDDRISAFVSQRRLPGAKPHQIGPLQKFSAPELQDQIRTWQQSASDLYKKAAAGGDVPLTKNFTRALPRGGNKALQTAMPELAPINARLQRLGRLEEQAAIVGRKLPIALPAAAAVGGSLTGGDAKHRLLNAGVDAAAMAALLHPSTQGYGSLLLSSPIFQRMLREGSRYGMNSIYPDTSR